MDANVLIDYRDSDLSIFGLVNRHVGEVHILTTILNEVDGLDQTDCEQLGLKVIEPELAQLVRAAAGRGQLSFRDRLCLIVSHDKGFVCVTNDKALRKACEEENVTVLWGLEMMTALVRIRAMQTVDAIRTAETIHSNNKLHISRKLVDQFAQIVTDIEKKYSDE
jgi:rRNA-processing protein FCF1